MIRPATPKGRRSRHVKSFRSGAFTISPFRDYQIQATAELAVARRMTVSATAPSLQAPGYTAAAEIHPNASNSADLNARWRLIPYRLTAPQHHSTSGPAYNLQCMGDPVLPWFRLRAGEADVHECAHDTDEHAVQDDLRVNPPSQPHGNSECGDERRWWNDVDQDSPCAAQE